jgi:hypothetical protein
LLSPAADALLLQLRLEWDAPFSVTADDRWARERADLLDQRTAARAPRARLPN